MKLFSLLVVAVAVLGVSCERHEFEGPDGTKQLHQHGGHADHGDHVGHDDSEHGEASEHAEPSEHSEHGEHAEH